MTVGGNTPIKQQIRDRYLPWQGCYNTRDLGGLPAVDGVETRWGVVVRSDILSRLTEEGQQALLDYGIRTIIDLRGPQEVQEYPYTLDRQTAAGEQLTYVNLPLEKYYSHVGTLIEQATTRGEIYNIILDHYPDLMAGVMRTIIQRAERGGVVIHCHAGKDRTGIVSALLLRLAGVPADIVAADYAESQQRLWPLYEKTVAEAGGEDKVSFWAKPTVTAEMITMMLDHLDARYGGVEEYLRAAGLSAGEIEELKNCLRS
jgi:protein tyrosine/serine phosphatase